MFRLHSDCFPLMFLWGAEGACLVYLVSLHSFLEFKLGLRKTSDVVYVSVSLLVLRNENAHETCEV